MSGKTCGVLSSPIQRRTPPALRVQPLIDDRAQRLVLDQQVTSASSTMIVGSHFSIERNSAASEIPAVIRPRGTRKPTIEISVVLPLLASADVASRIGEWTAAASCTQANNIHSATATACSSLSTTCRVMRPTIARISPPVSTASGQGSTSQ